LDSFATVSALRGDTLNSVKVGRTNHSGGLFGGALDVGPAAGVVSGCQALRARNWNFVAIPFWGRARRARAGNDLAANTSGVRLDIFC
jgi:hypothetical protein